MADGIFVAAAGAIGQLRSLEVVANNLANSVTPGYKQDEISFREVLEKADTSGDVADKRYVQVAETKVRREQGAVTQTGNTLDVALTGNAFLQVQGDDGVRLTRNGRMTVDNAGYLRTTSGHAVLDRSGGALRVGDAATVRILKDGAIVDHKGTAIGHLGVQGVDKDTPLRKLGDGLFEAAQPSPLSGDAQILQGYIEQSNANPVKTMVQLVETQRTFSALHQIIQTYQEVDRRAIELSKQA